MVLGENGFDLMDLELLTREDLMLLILSDKSCLSLAPLMLSFN